jgi:hypothetical protein
VTATSWLQTLAARGVTVTLRNNRIDIHPYIAFSQLSDEELLFLRHNREAIKAVVRAGFAAPTVSENDEDHRRATISEVGVKGVAPPAPRSDVDSRRSVIGRSESAPITTACHYCGGPCVGDAHFAYRALHYHDPEEVKRRAADATAEMNESVRRASRGLPRIQW